MIILVSEMTYNVSSGMLNLNHSLTHDQSSHLTTDTWTASLSLSPILLQLTNDNNYQQPNSAVLMVFLIDYKNCSKLID